MEACKYDKDCPSVEVCYSGVRWLNENSFPQGNNQIKNCYCSSYFGIERNPETGKCTEFTSVTYTFITIDALYIGVSFIGFILSLLVIKNSKILSNCSLNASETTLILTCISFLIMSAEFVVDIGTVGTPYFEPIVYCDVLDEKSQKCGNHDLITGILHTIMIACSALACLNVSLIWIEISSLAKASMKPNVTKYRKPMIVSSVIFFVAVLILGPITDSWEYTVFVTAPFFAWIMVCYTYGFRLMKQILDDQSQFNAALPERVKARNKAILDEIRKTSFIVVITIAFLISDVFAYTYIAYTGWRNFAPIGKFPLATIIDYGEAFFVLILNFSVLRYLHFTMYSSNKKSNETTRVESTRNVAPKISSKNSKSFKTRLVLPSNSAVSQANQNSHHQYQQLKSNYMASNQIHIVNDEKSNGDEGSVGAIIDETSRSWATDKHTLQMY